MSTKLPENTMIGSDSITIVMGPLLRETVGMCLYVDMFIYLYICVCVYMCVHVSACVCVCACVCLCDYVTNL